MGTDNNNHKPYTGSLAGFGPAFDEALQLWYAEQDHVGTIGQLPKEEGRKLVEMCITWAMIRPDPLHAIGDVYNNAERSQTLEAQLSSYLRGHGNIVFQPASPPDDVLTAIEQAVFFITALPHYEAEVQKNAALRAKAGTAVMTVVQGSKPDSPSSTEVASTTPFPARPGGIPQKSCPHHPTGKACTFC